MVTFKTHLGVIIIKLIGDLLKADLHLFYDKIENHYDDESFKFVIDLSNVSTMNSGGLGQLVSIIKYIKGKNLSVCVFCPDPYNIKHLKFIRMDEFVNVYEDLNDAINYMHSKQFKSLTDE